MVVMSEMGGLVRQTRLSRLGRKQTQRGQTMLGQGSLAKLNQSKFLFLRFRLCNLQIRLSPLGTVGKPECHETGRCDPGSESRRVLLN